MLDTTMIMPNSSVVYACPEEVKKASGYLGNVAWVRSFKATVKGVRTMSINDDLKVTVDCLAEYILS